MDFTDVFKRITESNITKGISLSVLFSIFGFVGNQAVREYKVDTAITSHTADIATLKTGQSETHDKLADVAMTLSKIDGKLDVVNQKIDDDRWNEHNWDLRHRTAQQDKR